MAACSGCSGCCGTWPCSWTGQTRPAGLRTASRTCWATSPTSSAVEPPAPSSDRYGTHRFTSGGRRGRGGRRRCLLKLARSQSPTAGDIERNAVIPTVRTLPSHIVSSVSVAGQLFALLLPVYNNVPPFWKAHYCFFLASSFTHISLLWSHFVSRIITSNIF